MMKILIFVHIKANSRTYGGTQDKKWTLEKKLQKINWIISHAQSQCTPLLQSQSSWNYLQRIPSVHKLFSSSFSASS